MVVVRRALRSRALERLDRIAGGLNRSLHLAAILLGEIPNALSQGLQLGRAGLRILRGCEIGLQLGDVGLDHADERLAIGAERLDVGLERRPIAFAGVG